MKPSIRGVILGTLGLALGGLAGCSEDNAKNASEDFKNTQTAPAVAPTPTTKADVGKQYNAGKSGYPGAPKSAPANPDQKK
jgi:hypothetical protein